MCSNSWFWETMAARRSVWHPPRSSVSSEGALSSASKSAVLPECLQLTLNPYLGPCSRPTSHIRCPECWVNNENLLLLPQAPRSLPEQTGSVLCPKVSTLGLIQPGLGARELSIPWGRVQGDCSTASRQFLSRGGSNSGLLLVPRWWYGTRRGAGPGEGEQWTSDSAGKGLADASEMSCSLSPGKSLEQMPSHPLLSDIFISLCKMVTFHCRNRSNYYLRGKYSLRHMENKAGNSQSGLLIPLSGIIISIIMLHNTKWNTGGKMSLSFQ